MDDVIALAEQIFKIKWIKANEIMSMGTATIEFGTKSWTVEIGGIDKSGVTHNYTGTGDSLIESLQDIAKQFIAKLKEKEKE
jgi:hypothetical protein